MPLFFALLGLIVCKKFKAEMEVADGSLNQYTDSAKIRVESASFGFFFVLVFADTAILFTDHITLDLEEGTRLVSNFIGAKSMSYWAGVLLIDFAYGLIPLMGVVLIGMAGVIMPQVLYFWILIFSGCFFWF